MRSKNYEWTDENQYNSDLEYKIVYILQNRNEMGKPLDEEWLRKQDSRIINGIYYEIFNSQLNFSSLTLDQAIKLLKEANVDLTKLEYYLQNGYNISEEEQYYLEYYDVQNKGLSDGEKLAKRIARKEQIEIVLNELKRYPIQLIRAKLYANRHR